MCKIDFKIGSLSIKQSQLSFSGRKSTEIDVTSSVAGISVALSKKSKSKSRIHSSSVGDLRKLESLRNGDRQSQGGNTL